MKLDIKTLAPLYACLALALTACGGGGGDSTSDTTTATATATATASGCLNTNSLVTGYSDSLTYQYTAKASTDSYVDTGTSTVSSRVIGTVVFNGINAVKSAQTETMTQGSATSTTKSYVYANFDDKKYVEYGSEELNAAGSVTSTLIYKPAYVLDFSLAAGNSSTSTYTQTTNAGTPVAVTSTLKFVGLESLTTAVGTFTSVCRFSQQDTWTGTSVTSDIWLSSGSMIPLKTVDTYLDASVTGHPVATIVTRELTAGTINGVALKP